MHLLILSDDTLPAVNPFFNMEDLRIWGIGSGLSQKGVTVSYMVPEDRRVHDVQNDNIIYYSKSNFRKLIDQIKPDAVLAKNWQLAEHYSFKNIPLIIDLSAPVLYEDDMDEISIQVKMISFLKKGDFFICSTKEQKWFYLNYLIQSGFDSKKDLIKVVPTYIPSSIFAEDKKVKSPKISYVSYWNDADSINVSAMRSIINYMDSSKDNSLKIFSEGDFCYNGLDMFLKYDSEEFFKSETLCIEELVGWDELVDDLKNYNVGVCLEPVSIHSESRIPLSAELFLSNGLPLVCTKGTALGQLVESYNAGWAIDADNPEELCNCLASINNGKKQVALFARNAKRIADKLINNIESLNPILDFIKSPVKISDTAEGIIPHLVNHSRHILNMDNPLLNDIYIENILIMVSGSWEQLEDCLEIMDIMFPFSSITLLCPDYLLLQEVDVPPDCSLIIYESDDFCPELVQDVLSYNSSQRYDICIALFKDKFVYSDINLRKALLSSCAKYKVGFTSDRNFVLVEDSIEKYINEAVENIFETSEMNNFIG